jgi:hypothetical protein
MDPATEAEHLARAERDIAEGAARIARQAALIDRLQDKGRDVAAELLANLRQALGQWQDHRDEIPRTIDRLAREPGPPPGGG